MPKINASDNEHWLDLHNSILGLKQQEEERNFKHEFPPCNLEYKSDPETTRFWCTTVSCKFTQFISFCLTKNPSSSILVVLSVTGLVIQFNSLIKIRRLFHVSVPRKSNLIYLNCDHMITVMRRRDLVLRSPKNRAMMSSSWVTLGLMVAYPSNPSLKSLAGDFESYHLSFSQLIYFWYL